MDPDSGIQTDHVTFHMKPGKVKYRSLGLSCLFTFVCLVLALISFDAVTPEICLKKLGIPLTRLMGFIFIGLLAGQLIELLGWTKQMAVVARPFFRFSRLGNRCSAAFTTAFVSGAAANAMLVNFYDEKKISKMQLFLSNYVNQFPAYFLHLPTTVFIVLPLTGKAGLLYFFITFLAVSVRTLCFFIFGKLYIKTSSSDRPVSGSFRKELKTNKPAFPEIVSTLRKRLPGRIINISIWVLPIYTLVFLLNINGFFDYLNTTLSRYVTLTVMPVESLSIVILSFAAEFTSGFAAAGALMDAGVLTVKQTVIALLLGNVLAFPIRALRHQLPRYMGIFSPKMGLQLLLSGQAFRIVSIIFMGVIYYWVA